MEHAQIVLQLVMCPYPISSSAGRETVRGAAEGPAAQPGPIREPQAKHSELRRFPQKLL